LGHRKRIRRNENLDGQIAKFDAVNHVCDTSAVSAGSGWSASVQHVIEQLRQELPPVFAGPSLDKLTGDAIRWRTIQNRRSQREIPDECFFRSGTRVLVLRDKFLNWWETTLSRSREAPGQFQAGRGVARQRTGTIIACEERPARTSGTPQAALKVVATAASPKSKMEEL
jgi:hypothetical protein